MVITLETLWLIQKSPDGGYLLSLKSRDPPRIFCEKPFDYLRWSSCYPPVGRRLSAGLSLGVLACIHPGHHCFEFP